MIDDDVSSLGCLPFEVVLGIFDAFVRVSTCTTQLDTRTGRAGTADRGQGLVKLSLLGTTWRRLYEPVLYRHVRLVGPRAASQFRRSLQGPNGVERAKWVRTMVILAHGGETMVAGAVSSQHALDVDAILFRVGPSTTHLILSPALLASSGTSAARAAYRLGQAKQVHLIGPDSTAEHAVSYQLALRAAPQYLFEMPDPLSEALAGFASRQEDDLLDIAAKQVSQSSSDPTSQRKPRLPSPLIRRLQHGHLLALKRIELHMCTPASASALAQISSLEHVVLSRVVTEGHLRHPAAHNVRGLPGPGVPREPPWLESGSGCLARATLYILLSAPSLQQLIVVDEPMRIVRYIFELVSGHERRQVEQSEVLIVMDDEDKERQARMEHAEALAWSKLLWRFQSSLTLTSTWTKHNARPPVLLAHQGSKNEWVEMGRKWVCSDPGRSRAGQPPQDEAELTAPWARQPKDLQGADHLTQSSSEALLETYQTQLLNQAGLPLPKPTVSMDTIDVPETSIVQA